MLIRIAEDPNLKAKHSVEEQVNLMNDCFEQFEEFNLSHFESVVLDNLKLISELESQRKQKKADKSVVCNPLSLKLFRLNTLNQVIGTTISRKELLQQMIMSSFNQFQSVFESTELLLEFKLWKQQVEHCLEVCVAE